MPNSRRFNQLNSRVRKLSESFLPSFKTSGRYTIKESDNIRAYNLLTHAEIESYFEDTCKNILNKAFNKWKRNNEIHTVMLNLACYHKGNATDTYNSTTFLHHAKEMHIRKIDNNHGIKEDNLKALFNSVGYEFDNTFLAIIGSFGEIRGHIAHNSYKVQTSLDPEVEKNRVESIVNEIGKIDLELKKLR